MGKRNYTWPSAAASTAILAALLLAMTTLAGGGAAPPADGAAVPRMAEAGRRLQQGEINNTNGYTRDGHGGSGLAAGAQLVRPDEGNEPAAVEGRAAAGASAGSTASGSLPVLPLARDGSARVDDATPAPIQEPMSSAGATLTPYKQEPAQAFATRLVAGAAAVQAMSEPQLASVAASVGWTASKLKSALETDASLKYVPSAGRLMYSCRLGSHDAIANGAGLMAASSSDVLLTPHNATGLAAAASAVSDVDVPVSVAFQLHSRPGASRVIYLHFKGQITSGTVWRDSGALITPPFDMDGVPDSFSDLERKSVVAIWRAVAEDFAPFQVDVTTEEPTISLASGIGTRVVIGGSSLDWFGLDISGVAWIGSFGNGSTGSPRSTANSVAPVFVFSASLGNDVKRIFEAISHEVGHSLGLSHDGQLSGTNVQEYYVGRSGWAPIMGLGYYQGTTQWSKGEYVGASNVEDDIAIMARSLPLTPDDVADVPSFATPLTLSQPFQGMIGVNGDVDMFSFQGAAGSRLEIQFSVLGDFVLNGTTLQRSNLNAELRLLTETGAQLATWAKQSDGVLDGTFVTDPLPRSATYYLAVTGAGQRNPINPSEWIFTSYGSAGLYTIQVEKTSGAGNVFLFTQCSFLGDQFRMEPGRLTTMPQGFSSRSSLSVPAGWTVVLYQGTYFDGPSFVVNATTQCLTGLPGASALSAIGSATVYAGGIDYPEEYVGCYKPRDNADPSLAALLMTAPQGMTPTLCRDLALAGGYRFYAILNGTRCYAGQSSLSLNQAALPGGCQAPCPGDARLKCGGVDENSLYEISTTDREYIGCVSMGTQLPLVMTSPQMTPELCRMAASNMGFNVFATTNSSRCHGAYFTRNLEANKTTGCTSPCGGNQGRACGGSKGQASLYRIVAIAAGTICTPGFGYVAQAGNCSICSTGSYAPGGIPEAPCTPCGPGYSTFDRGSVSEADCKYCARGYGYKGATGQCSLCEVGFFGAARTQFDDCQACPANFTTATAGAHNSSMCSVCAPGYGGPRCLVCGVGTYSQGGNATNPRPTCTVCPANTITLAAGATSAKSCIDPGCRPGWGGPTCTLCTPGTWSPGGSARPNCTACPVGRTTLLPEATTVAACVACAPGFGGSGAAGCSACGVGFYGQTPTSALPRPPCAKCPTQFTTASTGTQTQEGCTLCSAGYGGPTCSVCRFGAWSIGGNASVARPECTSCPEQTNTTSQGATSSSACLQTAAGAQNTTCSYLHVEGRGSSIDWVALYLGTTPDAIALLNQGLDLFAPITPGTSITVPCAEPQGYENYGSAGYYTLTVYAEEVHDPLELESQGCFKEAEEGRTLPDLLADLGNMTNAMCRKLAAAGRYRYYATQARSQCWAGNTDPTFLGLVEGGCRAQCAGNGTDLCGGVRENKLYLLNDADREYRGCYTKLDALVHGTLTSATMSPSVCRDWAIGEAGLNVYWLKNSTTCEAAQMAAMPNGTIASSPALCNTPCAGDESVFCGGATARSVYMIIGDKQGSTCDVSIEWGRCCRTSGIGLNEIKFVHKSGQEVATGEFTMLMTSTQASVSNCFDGDTGTMCATAPSDPNPAVTARIPCSGSATAAFQQIQVYNAKGASRNSTQYLKLRLRNKAGSIERTYLFKGVQDKYVFNTSQPTDEEYCAPGSGGAECARCAAGTFSPGWRLSASDTKGSPALCQPCPPGMSTPRAGSTSSRACTVCQPGFGYNATGNATFTCSSCGPGLFSTGGTSSCQACPNNATSLVPAAPGSRNCSVCRPGFGAVTAASMCSVCPRNLYSEGGNSNVSVPRCAPCPAGSSTKGLTGSKSLTSCIYTTNCTTLLDGKTVVGERDGTKRCVPPACKSPRPTAAGCAAYQCRWVVNASLDQPVDVWTEACNRGAKLVSVRSPCQLRLLDTNVRADCPNLPLAPEWAEVDLQDGSGRRGWVPLYTRSTPGRAKLALLELCDKVTTCGGDNCACFNLAAAPVCRADAGCVNVPGGGFNCICTQEGPGDGVERCTPAPPQCTAKLTGNAYCVGCSTTGQGSASVCVAPGGSPCQLNTTRVLLCSGFAANSASRRQDGCNEAWVDPTGMEYQFRQRAALPPVQFANITRSCAQPAAFTRLRLMKDGKENRTEGRLEVQMGSWWGAVCGDAFQAKEARVVCRMRGKGQGKALPAAAYGPSATVGIVMSNVNCTGAETSLASCRFDRGRGPCLGQRHVGVQCWDLGDACVTATGTAGKRNSTGDCAV